jgi:alpha-beta hydrolase superfamily lysophospholipase
MQGRHDGPARLALDQAAVDRVAGFPGPLSIVATSFGAVSTALSLRCLDARLHGLVLWCPVLDVRHTFIEPELPWGLENFGAAGQEWLAQHFAVASPKPRKPPVTR